MDHIKRRYHVLRHRVENVEHGEGQALRWLRWKLRGADIKAFVPEGKQSESAARHKKSKAHAGEPRDQTEKKTSVLPGVL